MSKSLQEQYDDLQIELEIVRIRLEVIQDEITDLQNQYPHTGYGSNVLWFCTQWPGDTLNGSLVNLRAKEAPLLDQQFDLRDEIAKLDAHIRRTL